MASVAIPRLVTALALLAAAVGCKGSTGTNGLILGGNGQGGGPTSADFSAFDLEGTWRGWSEPFNPFDQRLELTLSFEAYAPANNAVALTQYSFLSPIDGKPVDYLDLLDGYDLLFLKSGRLSLDTEYRSYSYRGIYVEELVYKDMQMNDAGDCLEGGETIEVYENGHLTVYYEGWLTLNRVD